MHHYFKHIGDLNINPLDFKNKKFQGLVNLIFDDGMVSAINKTACVARHATTAFDLVFTKSIINTGIKSTIVKTDISDHFSNEILVPERFRQKFGPVTWNMKTSVMLIIGFWTFVFLYSLFSKNQNQIKSTKKLNP